MGMKNQLRNLFQYSRDAVLCVKGNRILFANSSAAELFREDLTGKSASRHLPEHLLGEKSDGFISSAEAAGRSCPVSAARWQELLILTFYTGSPEFTNAGFVSEGLIASMSSALCNIAGAMDLLSDRRKKMDKEDLRFASIAYHNYYMLRHLIKNMEAALAFGSKTMPFLPQSTDLAQLCSQLASTSELMLRDRANISFSTDVGELIANIDPNLIERLLLNLLANSAAHTPPDGQIILGLKSGVGKAVISVDDNGSGIPAQILKNVFTGYRVPLSASLTSQPSGGLGLGICRSIAKIHGGTIIIESREGKGTSVRVLLPLSGGSLAQETVTPIPDMNNILTEFSDILDSSDYARELMD